MKRHLLLVGLPGSGKTAAGERAAEVLGAPFTDVDEQVEAAEGMAIRQVFAERGEPAFRELERRAVETALTGPPGVVAPGGGWAAQGANMEYAAGRALVVYLSTEPSVAAARAAPGGSRPLLDGPEPAARMQELLAAREGYYEGADAVVPTDGRSVDEVAAALVQLARSRAGW